jgi:hypothetical protein
MQIMIPKHCSSKQLCGKLSTHYVNPKQVAIFAFEKVFLGSKPSSIGSNA